jgi:hypothetical protein
MAETLTRALGMQNRAMVAVEAALGAGAIAAPERTLRLMGHEDRSAAAVREFRRFAPIFLTLAAAHALAAVRGNTEDWWALAGLRATELATEPVWKRSAAFSTPTQRRVIAGAAGANLAMSLGLARVAARRKHTLSGAVLRMALRSAWREARATAKDGRARVRAVASRA